MKLASKLVCKTYDKLLSNIAFIRLKNMSKNVQSLRLTGLTIHLKRTKINNNNKKKVKQYWKVFWKLRFQNKSSFHYKILKYTPPSQKINKCSINLSFHKSVCNMSVTCLYHCTNEVFHWVFFQLMWPNQQKTPDLITFTEKKL